MAYRPYPAIKIILEMCILNWKGVGRNAVWMGDGRRLITMQMSLQGLFWRNFYWLTNLHPRPDCGPDCIRKCWIRPKASLVQHPVSTHWLTFCFWEDWKQGPLSPVVALLQLVIQGHTAAETGGGNMVTVTSSRWNGLLSVNLLNPALKPSKQLAIVASCGRESHRSIMSSVKTYHVTSPAS